MNQDKVEYKRKKKVYEAYGARKFQKVVMKVERIKWSFIKKHFPNYLTHYEKYYNRKCQKALKKASNDKEREIIISNFRHHLLKARKEFNHNENCNYHLDTKRPTETINYLKWNKSVHEHGIATNMAVGLAASGFLIAGVGPVLAATLIGIQAVSAVINWQCINLQNYNICRLEYQREAFEKREAKRQQEAKEKYGDGMAVIEKAFNNTKEESNIPTPKEVVAEIKNEEQLRQVQKMMELVKQSYQQQITSTNTKKFGGRK